MTALGRLVIAALLVVASCASDDADPTTGPASTADSPAVGAGSVGTTLTNGLDVVVTAVPDASGVAVALVFDIGSHHDPPDQSGMAHMIEHLYVTGATDVEPARTVDQLVQSYPLGWNAQTGEDYTVIATVVEAGELDDELARTAARLTGVSPTDADLVREEPRLQAELVNMFGGIPEIGAANLARERLRPTPNDGRRGGHPDHVAALTLADVDQRLALYHAGNAQLSVAGPIDPEAVLQMVTDLFTGIPAGPPPGDRAEPGDPTPGLHALPVPPPAAAQGEGRVAIAYPAPVAGNPTFPAFLVAAGRLFVLGQQAGFVTSYAPLDDPPNLLVGAPLPTGADPDAAAEQLHDAVGTVLEADLGADEGATTALQFGPILGLPSATGADSYGTAFRTARSPALGLDPEAVEAGLASLTQDEFALVVTDLGGQPVTGGAMVLDNG